MALFKVEICGVNTSKLPLLTEDETAGVADRLCAGAPGRKLARAAGRLL